MSKTPAVCHGCIRTFRWKWRRAGTAWSPSRPLRTCSHRRRLLSRLRTNTARPPAPGSPSVAGRWWTMVCGDPRSELTLLSHIRRWTNVASSALSDPVPYLGRRRVRPLRVLPVLARPSPPLQQRGPPSAHLDEPRRPHRLRGQMVEVERCGPPYPGAQVLEW